MTCSRAGPPLCGSAGLSGGGSVLTHENDRRWRIFHERVEQITASG